MIGESIIYGYLDCYFFTPYFFGYRLNLAQNIVFAVFVVLEVLADKLQPPRLIQID